MGRPTRPPLKKNGLPKYVTHFFDRHGKLRYRYRRTGKPAHYFQSDFPSREWWLEYDRCEAGSAQEPKKRADPGSIGDLVSMFVAVPARLGPSETTQYKNRRIIDEFRTAHGHRRVADVSFEALDVIIAAKAKDAPWQAKKLRRLLARLFAFAAKKGMITRNPVEDTETIKATTDGYHTWTEAEITQFIARHPIGTKPYLALMLMLWTFTRRGDAIRLAPAHVADGSVAVKMKKAGKGRSALQIEVAPQLAEAIEAMPEPASPDTPFLTSERGTPFGDKYFGNWFRRRCNEADLPHCSAHGLRKAASRRAAELGLSNQSIKSVTGHRNDSEVALYTAAASQKALAKDAIGKLAAWDLSNRPNEVDK